MKNMTIQDRILIGRFRIRWGMIGFLTLVGFCAAVIPELRRDHPEFQDSIVALGVVLMVGAYGGIFGYLFSYVRPRKQVIERERLIHWSRRASR